MYFVGFNSVPNFIVILFNLLYPVFVVGFYCKGCVIEREYVKIEEFSRVARGYVSCEMKHVPCT